MQKMIWTEGLYGTGDPTIDKQHQELFDLINLVLDAFTGRDERKIDEALNKCASFCKFHFSCEEGIMEKKKCVVCDVNKKAHHAFLTEFTKIHEEFKKSGATMTLQDSFYKFVANWLRSHIMTIDTRVKEVSQ